MKVAITGLGVIGAVHLETVLMTGEELVALCDNDRERLKPYEGQSGVKFYEDYLTMLDEVKPDVVHICTPHYLHADMTVSALERGINVLCEKPLCIREEDISRILDAEKKSKAILGVCFQNRYNLSVAFAREYLKDRKITGAYGVVLWDRDRAYYDKDAWRGTRDLEGGGVLINQAIHTIDLLQYFVGMPKSVSAWCDNISLKGVIETEDTATVTCRGDVDFTLLATNAGKTDYPVEIVFKTEDGTVRLLSDGVYINDEYHERKGLHTLSGKKVYGDGHIALTEDFYDCIKTGRKFPIDGAEGAKAVRIVLAAYASDGAEIIL